MLKSTKKPNQSNFLGMLKTPANAGAKAYCQNGLDAYLYSNLQKYNRKEPGHHHVHFGVCNKGRGDTVSSKVTVAGHSMAFLCPINERDNRRTH